MKYLMMLALPCLLLLALVGMANAQDRAVVEYKDGYTRYADDPGYWVKDGVKYTKVYTRETPGYYSYGVYYSGTRYYDYIPVTTGVATYKLAPIPSYGPKWKERGIEWLKERDDHIAYQAFVQLAGLKGLTYDPAGAYTLYNQVSLGTFVPQGQSQYGYSYQQVLQSQGYSAVDLNQIFQQASRHTLNAQDLARLANSEFSQRLQEAIAGNSQLMEQLGRAAAAERALNAARGQPTLSVTGSGQGTLVTPPSTSKDPPPMDKVTDASVEQAKVFLQTVAVPNCAGCHTGDNPKGKFNVLTWPTLDPAVKAKYLSERIFTSDATKAMPPGKGLSADLKVKFAQN